MRLSTPEEVRARIGTEVGLSPWVEVSQDMINRFADLTDDHLFIHIDPVAAAATPFGGPIAHGFLVMSLLSSLAKGVNVALEGLVTSVNYGFDKVRMVSPVHAGKRIRGRFVLQDFSEKGPGQWLLTLAATVEIEGEARPALVAEWLSLQWVKTPG
jgi:acyl dehydratase